MRILVQRHNWVIFLQKWSSQWRSLSSHVERIFVHKNWRVGYWQHLVSTGLGYVPHKRSYSWCFAYFFLKIALSDAEPPLSCDLTTFDVCPSAERIWLCIRLNNAGLSRPAIDLQKMPTLAKKIIFSDEAHFDLGGYVNRPNCRFWGIENRTHTLKSRRTQNEPLLGADLVQRHNLDIFLRKWARRGRYSQCRSLSGHVERIFVNNWFQQDGATCHTVEATLDVLRPVFEDRIISRRADFAWPPRSCDLTPLDYYF